MSESIAMPSRALAALAAATALLATTATAANAWSGFFSILRNSVWFI